MEEESRSQSGVSYPTSSTVPQSKFKQEAREPLLPFEKLRGDEAWQGFVVKVFGILAAQMVVTSLFVLFCYTNESTRTFLKTSPGVLLTMFIFSIIFMCSIVCVKSLAWTVPTNYILLGLFTLCESYIVATVSSFYDGASVLLAAVMACVLFSILSLVALNTNGDL